MSLVKDNGFSLSGKIGGISGGIKFADNALTCDSAGNCMLKDNLRKMTECEKVAQCWAWANSSNCGVCRGPTRL